MIFWHVHIRLLGEEMGKHWVPDGNGGFIETSNGLSGGLAVFVLPLLPIIALGVSVLIGLIGGTLVDEIVSIPISFFLELFHITINSYGLVIISSVIGVITTSILWGGIYLFLFKKMSLWGKLLLGIFVFIQAVSPLFILLGLI